METFWFIVIAVATAAYAVTDGFDLGIGILFPLLGRDDVERGAVRATISHLWRSYEVWLIVLGGLLFLAFPRLYAVSFRGFYLAFMILLWCLIGRGLSLEVRSHLGQPVWRAACDALFPITSFLIAIALYPNLLPARPDPMYSLTIHNASAAPYGLKVAVIWLMIGLVLIGIYMLVTHRPFAGRVRPGSVEY